MSHHITRRMAFDPQYGDTRPSATLVHTTFGETADVSIDDLVGTKIIMQAVITHSDPDHNHTCGVCLADHVLYYWAALGVDKPGSPDSTPTASGFFITDVKNCKAKAYVNGRNVRLIPFGLVGQVQRDADGDVAFVVESGALLTMADILDHKAEIQATGLSATPVSAQQDAELVGLLSVHMTALFTGQDRVEEDERMDLTELAADPTYVVVLPNIPHHITPLVESLESGDLSRIEQGMRLVQADDQTEASHAVAAVSEGAAFYSLNIMACLSDEWWTNMYRRLVEGALKTGRIRHTDNPTHTTPHIPAPSRDEVPHPERDEDGRPIDDSPAPVADDSSMWDDIRNLL